MTEAAATPTAPTFVGYHHVAVTVRDIDRSEAWYTEVLGLARFVVEPHQGGTGYAVIMAKPGTGFMFGLEYHDDADQAYFTPNRTGLDHLAIQVETREALDEWAAHLDALGVDREPVVEIPEHSLAMVLFRDPDGMPLELYWHGH